VAEQVTGFRTTARGAGFQVLEISREPHEMISPRRSRDERLAAAAAEQEDLENREDPYNVSQASRIYFLPNLMTAGNLFCGFMAIVECIQARLAESSLTGEYLNATNAEHYKYAVWFIFGAAAFD